MSRRLWSRGKETTDGQGVDFASGIPAPHDCVPCGEVADADLLRGLNPRLLRVLAGLHGVPNSIAEATIQLLPFGSRAALEAEELAVLERGEDGEEFLRLTPRAYAAMAAAAATDDGTAEEVAEWEQRLERAHLANTTRRS